MDSFYESVKAEYCSFFEAEDYSKVLEEIKSKILTAAKTGYNKVEIDSKLLGFNDLDPNKMKRIGSYFHSQQFSFGIERDIFGEPITLKISGWD